MPLDGSPAAAAGTTAPSASPLLATRRDAPPAEVLGDSLDGVLARVRQAEREQYATWRAACQGGDPGLQAAALKAHTLAARNVVEVEDLVFSAKKTRGEFVDLVAAQERIRDRLAPLKAARPQLSRLLALALFPESPQRAQPRIELELGRILDPAVATAERPLVETAPVAAVAPPPAQSAA